MIHCTPQGLCSWNYALAGDGHAATLEFHCWGEQGTIAADGVRFDVHKKGWLTGRWSLVVEGETFATAERAGFFTRSLDLRDPDGALVLAAPSLISRRYELEGQRGRVATIEPVHAFTRRARIEIHDADCSFATIAFAFWLVAMTWRRAANNNSGGS